MRIEEEPLNTPEAAGLFLTRIRFAGLAEEARIMCHEREPRKIRRTWFCGTRTVRRCFSCGFRILPGQRAVREEDLNCYSADRNHFWHKNCHPSAVDKEWKRVRNLFVSNGGWVPDPVILQTLEGTNEISV